MVATPLTGAIPHRRAAHRCSFGGERARGDPEPSGRQLERGQVRGASEDRRRRAPRRATGRRPCGLEPGVARGRARRRRRGRTLVPTRPGDWLSRGRRGRGTESRQPAPAPRPRRRGRGDAAPGAGLPRPEAAAKAAYNLGTVLADRGEVDEGMRLLQLAVDSGDLDESPAALLKLGVLRVQRGEVNRARRDFEKVVGSRHPEYSPQAVAWLSRPETSLHRRGTARGGRGAAPSPDDHRASWPSSPSSTREAAVPCCTLRSPGPAIGRAPCSITSPFNVPMSPPARRSTTRCCPRWGVPG